MISANEKYFVIEGMRRYGSNFHINLANLIDSADSTNTIKIKKNWTDDWIKFETMGRMYIKRKHSQMP